MIYFLEAIKWKSSEISPLRAYKYFGKDKIELKYVDPKGKVVGTKIFKLDLDKDKEWKAILKKIIERVNSKYSIILTLLK